MCVYTRRVLSSEARIVHAVCLLDIRQSYDFQRDIFLNMFPRMQCIHYLTTDRFPNSKSIRADYEKVTQFDK